MSQNGLAPRRTAHFLLERITGHGELFSELVSAGALSSLSNEDRARAQRITLGTLRMLDRADRMLKPFLQRRPPLTVQNVLRMGTVEIWENGEAAHGVVNSCVEIVSASRRTASMKGLVNAVLRKVAAERDGAWDRLPEPRLPNWLRSPLISAWGKPTVASIERAHAAGAPLDITAKASPDLVAQKLNGVLLPNGSIRLRDAGQVTLLDGYENGEWWVQDAAAAFPATLLNVQLGEKVADLCAAPGGKTMQLAAQGAVVTAVDISQKRMTRLQENLSRTKLEATCVVSDLLSFNERGFDAILLDAPCSATGTIRRHPDLPYAKDGSEFGSLIQQQSFMIDHALSLLKPGGRMVYSTCSLLPDEGEVQIDEALKRHKGLTTEAPNVAGISSSWLSEEGGLRLRPDFWAEHGGMDGFYMALLRKPA